MKRLTFEDNYLINLLFTVSYLLITHLGIDFKKKIRKVHVIDFDRTHALCDDSNVSEILLFPWPCNNFFIR